MLPGLAVEVDGHLAALEEGMGRWQGDPAGAPLASVGSVPPKHTAEDERQAAGC